jgi:EpsI family protein
VLLGEIWVLGKIMPRPGEGFILKREAVTGGGGVIPPESQQDEPAAGSKRAGGFLAHPQFMAAVAILVVTLALSSTVNDVEKIPERRSFSQFPLAIGQWEGKRQLLEQEIIDELDLSDYVAVNYWKPEAPPVDIYIAYYESQRKGASIHSPETCLPGGGWIFSQEGTRSVSLPGKNPSSITVKRVIMEKSGMRHLVYFWFSQRGRVLTSAYELKLYNLWDGLVKKRTDGALVRVLSPVDSSEKIDDADQRLQSFIGEMMPLLDAYIPGSSGN